VWFWRKRGKISWADHVKNEDALQTVKGEKKNCTRNKQRKNNWIGHIFRRNCLLKHFIAGKVEGMGIRGKRLK
jgi:hypothetical protein